MFRLHFLRQHHFVVSDKAKTKWSDLQEAPPSFSVTHPDLTYHVTAYRLLGNTSTQKHVVGLLHLMNHTNVIVAFLNERHLRGQQSGHNHIQPTSHSKQ